MLLKVLIVFYFYSYLTISQKQQYTDCNCKFFKGIGNRFIFFSNNYSNKFLILCIYIDINCGIVNTGLN